jgi:hypothetical protein
MAGSSGGLEMARGCNPLRWPRVQISRKRFFANCWNLIVDQRCQFFYPPCDSKIHPGLVIRPSPNFGKRKLAERQDLSVIDRSVKRSVVENLLGNFEAKELNEFQPVGGGRFDKASG